MIQLNKSREVFRAFGFPVSVHPSWLLVLLLLTWSLATGWFPLRQPDEARGTYWIMGVSGALALFACIILHELAHALVARRRGMPIGGITLFLFGGVAQLGQEPPTPATEFQVAIAGPVASALIGLVAWALGQVGQASGFPDTVVGVFDYVAIVNLVLIGFNAVPAFPLDGGRVLRSGLWRLRGDLRWATRVSAWIGSAFGAVVVLLGILSLVAGNVLGGAWFVLIGMFVRGAARGAYQQLLIRQMLEGEPVGRIADLRVSPVSPSLSVQELVEGYLYRPRADIHPVAQNGRLLGVIATNQIRSVPRERWNEVTVRDLMTAPSQENTISKDADAMSALEKMTRWGRRRLIVLDRGVVVGILSLDDLLELARIKLEIERQ